MKHIGAIIMKKFSYVTFITYHLHFSSKFIIATENEQIVNAPLTISKFAQSFSFFITFFVTFHKFYKCFSSSK